MAAGKAGDISQILYLLFDGDKEIEKSLLLPFSFL